MGSSEDNLDTGDLEAQLLNDPVATADDDDAAELGRILYQASFEEMERSYVNYDTVQWILISLLLILVYGVGLLMLLYIPIRRYVSRQDIRTRKLLVTSNSVVYKVTRPVFFPCFGLVKREKNILLHLITDVVIEQGCLQSSFGISSVRIEGMGLPTPGDDVRIQGMSNPKLFKKIVMTTASSLRRVEASSEEHAVRNQHEDAHLYESPPSLRAQVGSHPEWAWPRQGVTGLHSWQMRHSPGGPVQVSRGAVTGDALLHKLEGIEQSVRRIEQMLSDGQGRQKLLSDGLSGPKIGQGEIVRVSDKG